MLNPTQLAKIKELLLASPSPYLADCLDLVPEEVLHALHKMIWNERDDLQPIQVSRDHVEHDVAIIVGGRNEALHCKAYLTAF